MSDFPHFEKWIRHSLMVLCVLFFDCWVLFYRVVMPQMFIHSPGNLNLLWIVLRDWVTATGMCCPCSSPLSSKMTLSGPVEIMRLVLWNFRCHLSICHLDMQVYHKGVGGEAGGDGRPCSCWQWFLWRNTECCVHLAQIHFSLMHNPKIAHGHQKEEVHWHLAGA